ncbi:MAG: HEAT repeat domain-containing protein [Phycisphaerales bacterium]|nr:HEAT repeat domain-containing protein [Phycisphaerales bacterium]
MTPRRSAWACAIAALAVACGGRQENAADGAPKLPPLALQPRIAELKAMAATRSAPTEAAQKELRDLGDIALQLVESDPRTLTLSERALGEHADAWWILEPALAHEQVEVRQRAAWLCGQSRQTALALPLLLRLKYELDPPTVVWVADALARLGNDSGLAWLDAAIGSEATAQAAGASAIEALRARGVALAEQPTWDEVRGALRQHHDAWQQRGTTSLPGTPPPDEKQTQWRLAAHLAASEGTQLRPVDDAKYVMRRAGSLSVPLVTRILDASEPYLRTLALQVLADLGPVARPASSAVLPLLGDPMTSSYAVRTLGECGASEALPFLRPMLGNADLELRTAAARSLGLLRDEPSRALLRARLQDATESMDVRVAAAFGLCCFDGEPEAAAFLADREAKKDYHEQTLARLRERLTALGK